MTNEHGSLAGVFCSIVNTFRYAYRSATTRPRVPSGEFQKRTVNVRVSRQALERISVCAVARMMTVDTDFCALSIGPGLSWDGFP